MKTVKINDIEYIIEENINDCFDIDVVNNLLTEYFFDFDYILGDFSYDKVRLKGFCDKENKRFSKINDIYNLKNYIEDYCAYNVNYFLLKKVK